MNSQRAAWCFAGPALLVIGVFFFLPVLAALAMSLTDFDIYALADLKNLRFVGLRNYLQLLQTPLFWQALGNTLYFVVAGVPLSIAASLGAALLLHSKLTRFKGLFRTAFFAPVVTSMVAVAVIWRYLLHTRYGMINYGAGRAWDLRRSTGSTTRIGRCRRLSCSRLEELRLQHDHLPGRPAKHPDDLYEAAGARWRRRVAACSATSPGRCWRRRC
jgi:ABC-type Fe3+ transport system permease subunit